MANNKGGKLSADRMEAIVKACDQIYGGKLHDQFRIDLFQAGAGTSYNMNANEVIANLALEIAGKKKGHYSYIHPWPCGICSNCSFLCTPGLWVCLQTLTAP